MSKGNSSPLSSVLPIQLAYQYHIVPIDIENSFLKLGAGHAISHEIVSELEFLTGKTIEIIRLSEQEVKQSLKKVYGHTSFHVDSNPSENADFEIFEMKTQSAQETHDDEKVGEVSVISLVNRMITEAIETGASDIHIEPYDKTLRVRYRRDGVLQEARHPHPGHKQAILSRLKIMAQLDIAEKRRPQDGRIRMQRNGKVIDIRLSTLPTDFGEKVVLRILDKSQLKLDIGNLGLDPQTLHHFKQTVNSPHGMILVTGPTGSGKTTTLYAALHYLNSPEVNILTIEDPIEYHLEGINQSHVRSDIGYTFARALRAFLRQDPDIIMVGEIRDQDTAEIAIRAALTGHLVLSTLHTNDAPSTLTRLLDMGLEPFLISSSVKMVLAQRLLRKICENCKVPDRHAKDSLDVFERVIPDMSHISFFRGEGCEKCNGTGYYGRTAIFEAMPMTPSLAELVHRRAYADELRQCAIQSGMQTLQALAIEKIADGITSVSEALRRIEFI